MAQVKYLIPVALFMVVTTGLFAAPHNDLYIHGGTIYTMAGTPIEDGVIRVEDGKITYVGRRLKIPPDALTLDATDKVITPGFILAFSHLGMNTQQQLIAAKESPITPGYRALDIVNLEDPGFAEARTHGITAVNIMPPDERPVPGVGVVMKTGGDDFKKRIVKNPSALSINLVASYQPYESFRGIGFSSEVADIVALRSRLNEAKKYRNGKLNTGLDNSQSSPELHDSMFLKAINQEIPVMITAESPTEIERGLSLAEDFDFKPIFIGVHSIEKLWSRFNSQFRYLVVESAINNSTTSNFSPVSDDILIQLFKRNFHPQIAIDESGYEGTGAVRYYPLQASILQRLGISLEEALKTLTVYPAEMLELQDKLGTIEVGKDADIIIFNEGPLTIHSLPDFVIINGQIISEGRR